MSVDTAYQQAIHTIYICDDDDDDRLLVTQALHDINPGFRVRAIQNCPELLSFLSLLVPDIIFMDLDMPGKNGLECIQEIRQNQLTKHIPIVVYSSTSRNANIQVAYEVGADLFLTKPNEFTGLRNSLQKVTGLDWNDRIAIKASLFRNGNYVPFL